VTTQKTLDKQTSAFIGAVLNNLPNLSAAQMQYFIEKPDELKQRLTKINPTMSEFLKKIGLSNQVDLIEIFPGSDLRIMWRKEHPDLGILVSNRHNTCGKGLRLALHEKNGIESFRAPCGCCNWAGQFSGSREQEAEVRDGAVKAIRAACVEKGIKILIFHCWHSAMKQNVDGLKLVDPYQETGAMKDLEEKLRPAFGWLNVQDNEGNMFPFCSLYEK